MYYILHVKKDKTQQQSTYISWNKYEDDNEVKGKARMTLPC